MEDVLFILAVAGAAFSLCLLHVGKPYRWTVQAIEKFVRRDNRSIEEQDGVASLFVHCPMCNAAWIAFFCKIDWSKGNGSIFDASADPILYAFSSVSITFVLYAILKLGFKDEL